MIGWLAAAAAGGFAVGVPVGLWASRRFQLSAYGRLVRLQQDVHRHHAETRQQLATIRRVLRNWMRPNG